MPKKIYLDATHTYHSGLNSGIQRVVKNIVKHAPEVAKELDIEIIPLVWLSSSYYTFEHFPQVTKESNRAKSLLKKIYRALRASIAFFLPKKLSSSLYSPSIGSYCNNLVDKLLSPSAKRESAITLESGDILLLIDTTWLNNNYAQLKSLKEKDVKIVALLYDIIPISHPEFCTVDLTLSLEEWYKKATPYIESFIAISSTVRDQTYSYIRESLDPTIKKEKFDYFYLGADLKASYDEAAVPQSFKAYFNKKTYLTVSTIEPRKNHSYIIETFEKLWEQDTELRYLMIGRVGWKTEPLIKRIKSHPLYNKNLFLLEDIDDNSLIYAYKNAKALLFASHIEGFGLPIVESLYYKLPVIASDTPIHREIGTDKILYFDPKEPSSLQEILQSQKSQERGDFSWIDWQHSTKELITKALSTTHS